MKLRSNIYKKLCFPNLEPPKEHRRMNSTIYQGNRSRQTCPTYVTLLLVEQLIQIYQQLISIQEQERVFHDRILSSLENIERLLGVDNTPSEGGTEGRQRGRRQNRMPLRAMAQNIAVHAIRSFLREMTSGGTGVCFTFCENRLD